MYDATKNIQTSPFLKKSGRVRVTFKTKHDLIFAGKPQEASLELSYEPDKLLLEQPAYTAFLGAHLKQNWDTPEALMDILVADFYDELVPLWVQAELTLKKDGIKQEIYALKEQPEIAHEST